ncbi:basic phospholipase A2 nigexine-like [Scyliorhinus torazame]|uniref:basic phospholipase A2 nigexine-like n=1 Tax=Scyliorhinus torazame TaxID=75743 RepID=UPI003B5913F3
MESPKLTAILIVLGAIWIPAQGVTDYQSMFNFLDIVHCVDPTLPYQRFMNYGCFCRFEGIGNQPVDDMDRCCKVHDDCSREAGIMSCPVFYIWHLSTCKNGFPKCDDFSVTSYFAGCVKKLCDCGIAAALCIKENSHKFNPKFVDYDRNLCKTVP